MRRCCGWQGWSVWKFKPIGKLNIWKSNMVKGGRMYSKQNWKWMLARLWKDENIGSYGLMLALLRNRTRVPRWESDLRTTMPLLKIIISYMAIQLKMLQSLSSKVGDKNGNEKQTKARWEWSGRHNENNIECGKFKWREKVLLWSENFMAAARCNGREACWVDCYTRRGLRSSSSLRVVAIQTIDIFIRGCYL